MIEPDRSKDEDEEVTEATPERQPRLFFELVCIVSPDRGLQASHELHALPLDQLVITPSPSTANDGGIFILLIITRSSPQAKREIVNPRLVVVFGGLIIIVLIVSSTIRGSRPPIVVIACFGARE